jgi:hypothetical protein
LKVCAAEKADASDDATTNHSTKGGMNADQSTTRAQQNLRAAAAAGGFILLFVIGLTVRYSIFPGAPIPFFNANR